MLQLAIAVGPSLIVVFLIFSSWFLFNLYHARWIKFHMTVNGIRDAVRQGGLFHSMACTEYGGQCDLVARGAGHTAGWLQYGGGPGTGWLENPVSTCNKTDRCTCSALLSHLRNPARLTDEQCTQLTDVIVTVTSACVDGMSLELGAAVLGLSTSASTDTATRRSFRFSRRS